jgi:DNA-binding HxlR family transcriptional regulator
MTKELRTVLQAKACAAERGLAFMEVLNSLSGKWKMVLVCTIGHDKVRFGELQKLLPSMTARTLSKELKELEFNGLVSRIVQDSDAALIKYSLTESALELLVLLNTLVAWGTTHRMRNINAL